MSGYCFDEREVSARIYARWREHQSGRPDGFSASVVDRQDQTGADCVREGSKLLRCGLLMMAREFGRKVIGLARGRGRQIRVERTARHDVGQRQQLKGLDTVGQVGLHHQSPSSGRGNETATAPESNQSLSGAAE